MTDTPPEPVPVPEAPGPLAHFEAWFAKHVFPDIADIRIKAENATIAVKKVAPVLARLGSVVQELAKTLDPADGPGTASLISEAEAVVAEAVKIGTELGGI